MASRKSGTDSFKFSVTFESREDGGLRAFSEDVPGFSLSHKDKDAVFRDVKPSLEYILSKLFDSRVKVSPLHDIRAALVEHGLVNPIEDYIDIKREYVVEKYVSETVSA
jgi:hypothetical protein